MVQLTLPCIDSARLQLRIPRVAEADQLLNYYLRNRRYLKPFEPRRTPEFYRLAYWQQQQGASEQEFYAGRSVKLGLFLRGSDQLIGVCNFSNIIHGAFKACLLGYALDEHHQGQGFMQEALSSALPYMFQQQGLHRVMANYLAHNSRSAKLLKQMGFRREGYARDYLQIDGRWQDHVLTALVRPQPAVR